MDCRIIKLEIMKKINNYIVRYQFVFVLLFIVQFAQAQPEFESDNVVDVPAAPIDQWILPMIALGIAMRYHFMKKKKQALVK